MLVVSVRLGGSTANVRTATSSALKLALLMFIIQMIRQLVRVFANKGTSIAFPEGARCTVRLTFVSIQFVTRKRKKVVSFSFKGIVIVALPSIVALVATDLWASVKVQLVLR